MQCRLGETGKQPQHEKEKQRERGNEHELVLWDTGKLKTPGKLGLGGTLGPLLFCSIQGETYKRQTRMHLTCRDLSGGV